MIREENHEERMNAHICIDRVKYTAKSEVMIQLCK